MNELGKSVAELVERKEEDELRASWLTERNTLRQELTAERELRVELEKKLHDVDQHCHRCGEDPCLTIERPLCMACDDIVAREASAQEQPYPPPVLSDVDFEHAIRTKGLRPNLLELGCMRTGYDLRCAEELMALPAQHEPAPSDDDHVCVKCGVAIHRGEPSTCFDCYEATA